MRTWDDWVEDPTEENRSSVVEDAVTTQSLINTHPPDRRNSLKTLEHYTVFSILHLMQVYAYLLACECRCEVYIWNEKSVRHAM